MKVHVRVRAQSDSDVGADTSAAHPRMVKAMLIQVSAAHPLLIITGAGGMKTVERDSISCRTRPLKTLGVQVFTHWQGNKGARLHLMI